MTLWSWVWVGALVLIGAAAVITLVNAATEAFLRWDARKQAAVRAAARHARLAEYQARVEAGGRSVMPGWWSIPGGKEGDESQ